METSDALNKVSQSGLITLDPGAWYPAESELVTLDISDQLFEGLMLREKDFREFIAKHNWSVYRGKHVAVNCSADAIIPHWAWMLLSSALTPYVTTLVLGFKEDLIRAYYFNRIAAMDTDALKDARIVIKGCSDKELPVSVYLDLTHRLQPFVKSIFYGEPCSTVPVYKRKVV